MDNTNILSILKEASSKIEEAVSLLSEPPSPAPVEENTVTLDALRTKLASLAANGHKAAVRKLLNKYGSSTVSGVNPSDYDAFMKEAMEVENAK